MSDVVVSLLFVSPCVVFHVDYFFPCFCQIPSVIFLFTIIATSDISKDTEIGEIIHITNKERTKGIYKWEGKDGIHHEYAREKTILARMSSLSHSLSLKLCCLWHFFSLCFISSLPSFYVSPLSVVGLSVSPLSDTFLSSSLDQSVRFWDVRTNICQGMISCSNQTNATQNHNPNTKPTNVLVQHDPAG